MSASSTVVKNRASRTVPKGFHTATPHLVCSDPLGAIDFYKKAFDAEEVDVVLTPEGQFVNGTVKIGDSFVMLTSECVDFNVLSPRSLGNSTVTIHLYVDDVDRIFEQAVSYGAKVAMPPMDMFWGDRYGKIIDPHGHQWAIATHIEDISKEEAGRRAAEACANLAKRLKKN